MRGWGRRRRGHRGRGKQLTRGLLLDAGEHLLLLAEAMQLLLQRLQLLHHQLVLLHQVGGVRGRGRGSLSRHLPTVGNEAVIYSATIGSTIYG